MGRRDRFIAFLIVFEHMSIKRTRLEMELDSPISNYALHYLYFQETLFLSCYPFRDRPHSTLFTFGDNWRAGVSISCSGKSDDYEFKISLIN